MNKDMEGLQSAELALQNLQKELEQALLAQENVATEKQNLEKKLQEAASTENRALPNSYSDVEVSQLKAEIEASTLSTFMFWKWGYNFYSSITTFFIILFKTLFAHRQF